MRRLFPDSCGPSVLPGVRKHRPGLAVPRVCWVRWEPTAGVGGLRVLGSSAGPHLAGPDRAPPCIFRFSKQPLEGRGLSPSLLTGPPVSGLPPRPMSHSQRPGSSSETVATGGRPWCGRRACPLASPMGLSWRPTQTSPASLLGLCLTSHSPGFLSSLENISWG